MLETMQSMLDTLRQPQTLHATLVHLPIAVSLLGLILVLMLMLGGGKSHGMRWAVFVLYLIGAVVAFFAHTSGEAAEHAMAMQAAGGEPMSRAATQTLAQHKQMGTFAWIPLAVVAVASLMSVFKASSIRVMMLVVTVIGSLFSAGWIAVAAHHGGQLVYEHGVGVPTSTNNLNTPRPLPGPTDPDGSDDEAPDDRADDRPPAQAPADDQRDPVDTPPPPSPDASETQSEGSPEPAEPEPDLLPSDPLPSDDAPMDAPSPAEVI